MKATICDNCGKSASTSEALFYSDYVDGIKPYIGLWIEIDSAVDLCHKCRGVALVGCLGSLRSVLKRPVKKP